TTAARCPGGGAAPLRRVQEQGPGSALRPVREGSAPGPPQRPRAARLPELLAPRPAELEALHEVREPPACRRGDRGRAGLPELPPWSCFSLQHLRGGRRRRAAADCTRCSLDRKLRQAFTPPDGAAAPELDRLREALVRVDRPDLMLDWLKSSGVRSPLQAVAARGAITHEALDALPPGRTLVHVRSMLVAAAALPARHE